MKFTTLLSLSAFIFVFSPLRLYAEINNNLQMTAPKHSGDSLKFKLEFESKTTYSKSYDLNGYSSEARLQSYYMFNKNWGNIVELLLNQSANAEQSKDLTLSEASFGLRWIYSLDGNDWKTHLTCNYLLQEEDRNNQFRDIFLVADVRVRIPLTISTMAQFRIKHNEYLPNKIFKNISIRQTKIELSPDIQVNQFFFGFKNHLTHAWLSDKETNTLSLAPFIQYKGTFLEPLFKIAFLPFDKSEQLTASNNWEQHPAYSFELEVNF